MEGTIMAVDAVGGSASSESSSVQKAVVNQEDLFKILLTQLNYQDPLKPMDNAEFIAQLAQFTSLEQTRQTNENIESLLRMQSSNQSIGLITRTVEVTTALATEVGQVTTITFDEGTPKLTIKTSDGRFINNISLSQVQIVR
jgi:flagellar basal-body rod modification protein FlgD